MRKAKRRAWIAWSKDEVKLLKELFPQGRAREVAEQTGRSLVAVKHKAYNMGIKTRECRRWSANDIRQLKRLYRDGRAREIAEQTGRSLKAVQIRFPQE